MRVRAKWFHKLLLAAGSLALGLAGMELWARETWAAPWHQRLVTEQARNQRLDYTENRFGLRDRDYPSPKPAGRLRLLIIGDSFTHGTGVVEDELIFPELLEAELNRLSWPGHDGVDVLNGGVSGSIPRQWAKLWLELQDDFDPDAVMIVFFLRDGTRFGSMDYFEDVLNEVSLPNAQSPMYRSSYLYRYLQDLRVKRGFLASYRGGFMEAYFGSKRETRLWRRAQEHLLRIKSSADERGISVGLTAFPILVDLREDYPFRAIVDEILEFGRDAGFRTVDMLPAFIGHDGPELWVSGVDQHPNARGHAIAAEALLPLAVELLEAAVSSSDAGQ